MRHYAPQRRHIAIVLFEGCCETVVPIAITDEVVKLSFCGMRSRPQRSPSRICNRPRRQARMPVRVVERVKVHIVVMQRSAVGAEGFA